MPQLAVRIATLVLVLMTASAGAGTPWNEGVSASQQRRANQLFAEGNELFAREAHAPAIAKYREAIRIWDHPMLRFNMAVALIRVERYLEAAEALEQALRFGDAPFTKELYRRATSYRDLVDRKLGTLEARCASDDIQVFVDGQAWFECPGEARRRVTPGEHVIVGERGGNVVMSIRVNVDAGRTRTQVIEPSPVRVGRTHGALVYTTPRWIPWAVFGLGAATLGTGVVMRTAAGRDVQELSAELERACPPTCDDVWAPERDRAARKATIGTALAISGGVVALGGLVWAAVNRPRHVVPTLELAPTKGGYLARFEWTF